MFVVFQKLFSIRYCLTVFAFFYFGLSGFLFAEPEPPGNLNETPEIVDSGEQRIIERFWTLLTNSPRRGTSLDRVYGFYVDSGQLETLLQRCRKQTEEHPEDAKTWFLLGLILSRSGNDQQAIESWQKSTSLAPSDLLTATYLGESLIADGKLKQAVEAMERTVNDFEKNVQESDKISSIQAKDLLALLQLLGRSYERFNDRQNADRIWQRIETLFPDDKEILQQIAEALENDNKLDEALKRYQRLAELSKENAFERTRYQLAATEIKIKQNRTQEAIENLDHLLDGLSGESWIAETVRDRIERLFSRNADYERLAAYYSERIETHPPELETIRRYAIVLFRLSRQDEAKAVLLQALEKAPENIPIRLALIDIFVAEKDFENVDRQYAEIDRIQANHSDYLTQWGLAVLENKNLDDKERKSKATKIWNRLIAAKPNDPVTVIMVAELMNSAGIFDEAEKLYQKAVELKPNDPGFKEYLGYFYYQRQEKAKAVEILRRMVDGNPGTATNLERLAGIFKSLGYIDEALKTFKEAVDLAPSDLNVRLQCIDLLLENGNLEQVEKELDSANEIAREINSESQRFLETEIKFFQATNRLSEKTTEKRRSLNRIEHPTAFDYWQLATYQTSLDQMREAEKSIDKAIGLDPNSATLLRAATKIYSRAGNLHRSVSVYEKLTETDTARRVEYLKQLVDLYRSVGESKKALETAKLVMASGAGNPANIRFYASTLWEAGQQKESIELLRRAVRQDSNDTVSLNALADALLEIGQRNEAIELLWRIFEKTDHLQGKFGLVSRLSELYRQSGDFNRLTERLKKLSIDAPSKRESAYCIAQAYVSTNRLDDARQTLESLLNDLDKKDSGDTTLLSQLSRVAELQGDMTAAIEYQETICKKIENADGSNRLLSLYRLSGNTEKTLDHLLRTVVEKGDLVDSLSMLDNLLASEDYVSAYKVVDRLKTKNLNNWQLLYRRLTLEFWCNNIDEAEKIAESFLSLNVKPEEPSSLNQHEKQAPNISGSLIRQGFHSPENWVFQPNQQPFPSGDTAILQRWQISAATLIKTLFRDRLEYVEGPSSSQSAQRLKGSSTSAEKSKNLPQFIPENFDEARFAVRTWLFRIALQRDIGETLKKNPVLAKRETFIPSEKSDFESRFTEKTIEKLRQQLSENSSDNNQLTERLRLEFFFDKLQETAKSNPKKFRETNYSELLFKDLPEHMAGCHENDDFRYHSTSHCFRTKIACELAFRGENDWFCTAYDSLLKELYADFLLEHYDENLLRQLQERFDLLVQDSTIRELFDGRQITSAKISLFDSIRNARKTDNPFQTGNQRTRKEKLDFLMRCWAAIENRSLENRPNGGRDIFLIAEQYPLFLTILRQQNEEKEIEIVESIYEKLVYRFPVVLGLWTDVCFSRFLTDKSFDEKKSLTNLIQFSRMNLKFQVRNSLPIQYHRSWFSDNYFNDLGLISPVYDFIKWKEQRKEVSLDQNIFHEFQSFVEKIEQFVLSDEFRVHSRQSGPSFPWPGFSMQGTLSEQAVLDSVVSKYLKIKFGPLFYSLQFNSDRFNNKMSFSVLGGMFVQNEHFRSSTLSSEKRKRTIAQKQLNDIKQAVNQVFRLSEFYLKLMNDIDMETSSDENDPNSVLVHYRRAFEVNLDDRDSVQTSPIRTLSGRTFQSRNVVLTNLTSSEQTFFAANAFLTATDAFLRSAEPSLELSEEEIGPFSDLVKQIRTFDLFLESRAKLGTETDCQHVSAYRTISTMFQGSHVPVESGIRMYDIRSYLETQKNQIDREKGKPSSRLLIMLAAAHYRLDLFCQAIEYLDAMDLKTQDDIRLREKWVLSMYNRSYLLGNIPKSRAEKAIRFFEKISDIRQTELLALQQSQESIGQKEQAQKNREKLLESAGDLANQIQILRQLAQGNVEEVPKIFEFAKKVFMEPDVQQAMSEDDGIPWKAREASLDLLTKSGKLETIIKEFETKYAENSESVETMISLADLYFRIGRMEQTEKMIRQIDEHISFSRSSDLRLFRAFAYRGNMKQSVSQWRYQTEANVAAKKLADTESDPAKILKNFQHYADLSDRYGLSQIFIERLEKIDSEQLAASFDEIAYYFERWLEKRTTKDLANQLWEHIWGLGNSDDKTKRRLRFQIVGKISHRTRQEIFYPMFRDAVFDFIMNSSEADRQNNDINPFVVKIWSVDQGFGTVTTLINLADQHGKMQELNKETRRLLQVDDIQKDDIKKALVNFLLSMTEARLGNAQTVVEILQPILNKQNSMSSPDVPPSVLHGDFLLAQELFWLSEPQVRQIAETLWRRCLINPTTDQRTKKIIENMLYTRQFDFPL